MGHIVCRYENELTVRRTVESDIAVLKALKKEYEPTTAALKQEYELLLKERDTLQSTHEQVRPGRVPVRTETKGRQEVRGDRFRLFTTCPSNLCFVGLLVWDKFLD